jgi:hypothetical protein
MYRKLDILAFYEEHGRDRIYVQSNVIERIEITCPIDKRSSILVDLMVKGFKLVKDSVQPNDRDLQDIVVERDINF